MSKTNDLQDCIYFVIADGPDSVGVMTYFSSLADAVAYADAMEIEGNAVTVEICFGDSDVVDSRWSTIISD